MFYLLLLLACAEPDAAPARTRVGPAGPPPIGQPLAPAMRPGPSLPRPSFPVGPIPAGARSIVWVSLDTVSAPHLALYGGRAATPNLAALAGEGRLYTRAYTHFVETAISHWTMLSGVLPEVHGNVPGNGGSLYQGPTAAEIARANGYATAAFIGGITLEKAASGLDRGFDVYDDEGVRQRETRPAAEVVGRAQSWWQAQTRPAFVFVHLFDAHFPYTPAEPGRYDPDYAGTFDGTDRTLHAHRDAGTPLAERDLEHVRALYEAEITEMDAALAPLWAMAGADSVVVVTADHGESFGHGYYFNHRASLHDETLHVPLVVRAPGLASGRDDRYAGLIDVLPTVLRLAGLSTGAPLMGKDLSEPGADVLCAQTDPWMPPQLIAVRTAGAKAIWGPHGLASGYDLVTDPGELAPGPVAAALTGAKESCRASTDALAPFMAPAPAGPGRGADPATAAQLEALGYNVPLAPAPR